MRDRVRNRGRSAGPIVELKGAERAGPRSSVTPWVISVVAGKHADANSCGMPEAVSGPSHRKLKAWVEAQALAVLTYQTCAARRQVMDRGLADQIRRAAISIPSNIAEGNARGSNKDSLRFLYIARGSLCELESQVDVCLSTGLLSREEAAALQLQGTLVGRLIGGLVRYRRAKLASDDGSDRS